MSAPAASHLTDALDEDLDNECPLVGVEDAADLTLEEAVQYARVSFFLLFSCDHKEYLSCVSESNSG
jgi:hypothetical protein